MQTKKVNYHIVKRVLTKIKNVKPIKMSDFSTLSGITRKVIITEQWTKKLENLVLSYEYTPKNY
jgi:hypothetical protein